MTRPRRRAAVLAVMTVGALVVGVVITVAATTARPRAAGLAEGAAIFGDGLALTVQVAETAAQQSIGLSGRGHLDPGAGMWFAFDHPAPRSFWMADTAIALDIAWVRNGRLVGVTSMQPCPHLDQCPAYPSPGAIEAAVEASPGTFDHLVVGTSVTLVSRAGR